MLNYSQIERIKNMPKVETILRNELNAGLEMNSIISFVDVDTKKFITEWPLRFILKYSKGYYNVPVSSYIKEDTRLILFIVNLDEAEVNNEINSIKHAYE